jgi:hypothetical protein
MAEIKNLWVMLFTFCAFYLLALIACMGAVVYYKFYVQNSLHSHPGLPSSPTRKSVVDDLFLQRMALLLMAFLYIMFTLIASSRVDLSPSDCFWWNFSVTATIGFEKYALFFFLFCKQDVLKKTIQEPRTKCDMFILFIMHFLPILGLTTGATATTEFSTENGCKQVTTSLMMTTYGLSTIVDIVVSVTLLRSFLGVIKKHVKIPTHERKLSQGDTTLPTPRAPSNDSDHGKTAIRRSSAPEITDTRFDQIHRMMQLNSRSCILSISAFFFTVLWSIILPMFITDPNIYLPLIGTVGCTDMLIDGISMLMCSPQVWQSLWKQVSPFEKDHTANSSEKEREHKRKHSRAQSNASSVHKETTVGTQTASL